MDPGDIAGLVFLRKRRPNRLSRNRLRATEGSTFGLLELGDAVGCVGLADADG
jgi:hypothetical protein